LAEEGICVDGTVTPDPWRIMRIPGTLHGETGLVSMKISDPLHFSLEQAKPDMERVQNAGSWRTASAEGQD